MTVPSVPAASSPSGRAGAPAVQRLRVVFSKGAAIRFIGHLDVVRLWERACRRAQLPLAYSLGFTPRPRLQFAAPLALGATGGREILDVFLTATLPPGVFAERLSRQLPEGCQVVDVRDVDVQDPATAAQLRWAEYRLSEISAFDSTAPAGDEAAVAPLAPNTIPWRPAAQRLARPSPPPPPPPFDVVAARLAALLAAAQWPHRRLRDGKWVTVDLRPLIFDLWLVAGGGEPHWNDLQHTNPEPGGGSGAEFALGLRLRAESQAQGRPDDVLAALGLVARGVHRIRLGLAEHGPDTAAPACSS